MLSGDNWHHQNKEWQKTLDLAREYGWPEPRPGSNHNTRLLSCPSGDHKTTIYSTGRSPENVARGFRKTIRNCQHSSHSRSILISIEAHLDRAEPWIKAAETAIALHATERKLTKLVNDAEDLMSKAEQEFDILSEEADALNAKLQQLVSSDPRPSVHQMADSARSDLRAAKQELGSAPSDASQLNELRARHKALSGRLNAVRQSLPRQH